jgi:hypothetical protein
MRKVHACFAVYLKSIIKYIKHILLNEIEIPKCKINVFSLKPEIPENTHEIPEVTFGVFHSFRL